MIDKIYLQTKKENLKLKGKIAYLEQENTNFRQKLGLLATPNNAVNYFLKEREKRIFS